VRANVQLSFLPPPSSHLLPSCSLPPHHHTQVCAENEGESCECTGTVVYGRKFVNGRPGAPGHGNTTTLAQLGSTNYFKKTSSGSINCENEVFGDPLPNVYKYCYCVPGQWVLCVVVGCTTRPACVGDTRMQIELSSFYQDYWSVDHHSAGLTQRTHGLGAKNHLHAR
jgi:hypothetical protein